MTIIEETDFPEEVWPTMVLPVLAEEIADAVPEIEAIAFRTIELDDPATSLGITVKSWDGQEFCIGARYPDFADYQYQLELIVRGTPRTAVVIKHAQLTKKLRTMLYQRPALYLRLPLLTDTSFGITEKFSRLTIGKQLYESGVTGNAFIAASDTTLIIRTENS